MTPDESLKMLRETMDLVSEESHRQAKATAERGRRKAERQARIEQLNPVGRCLGRVWIDLTEAPIGAVLAIWLCGAIAGAGFVIAIYHSR